MNEIIVQTIAQWGSAGIALLAAGWIIYENWKRSNKMEEWFRENLIKPSDDNDHCKKMVQMSIESIDNKMDRLTKESIEFRKDMISRVQAIEDTIEHHHPDKHEYERQRVEAITTIAPAVNSILATCLKDSNVDHIAFGLLHNGTASLSGIPYIKMGIIAEKYKPLQYPDDIDLAVEYRDDDITKYNRLPHCIMQNGYTEFDIEGSENLAELGAVVYNRCKKRGIKRIAFVPINDELDMCTGCIIAYSFEDKEFNKELLVTKAGIISDMYISLLNSLD